MMTGYAPDMGEQGTVYLLHFRTPYKGTQHYIGWSKHLGKRLKHHAKGTGARFLAVVHDAGIRWQLAREWDGTRRLERGLKQQKRASRFCPICSGDKAYRAGLALTTRCCGSSAPVSTTCGSEQDGTAESEALPW